MDDVAALAKEERQVEPVLAMVRAAWTRRRTRWVVRYRKSGI
jgi:hypothetical protein